MTTPILFAYITTPDTDTARRIGDALLRDRFAACVNILPGMESRYWWNGKLESSQETVLVAKTRDGLQESLIDRVRDLHPDKVPCIVFLPVQGGNPDYLEWLAGEAEAN